jgi:MobA-like NTP transferase domain
MITIEKNRKTNAVTSAVILCAGTGDRWNNYLGIPKQLIEIGGETLLDRTVRLLKREGVSEIYVITHNQLLIREGIKIFSPDEYKWTVESFLSTRTLWKDKTLVLLGDVFYTNKAMHRIVTSPNSIGVFGRPGASKCTFKTTGEIFALSFDSSSIDSVVEHLTKAREHAKQGGRGKLWEFYRSLVGFPLQEHRVESEIFLTVNDFTDDFDSPEEYRGVIARYQRITSLNPLKRLAMLGWVEVRYYLKCIKIIS